MRGSRSRHEHRSSRDAKAGGGDASKAEPVDAKESVEAVGEIKAERGVSGR